MSDVRLLNMVVCIRISFIFILVSCKCSSGISIIVNQQVNLFGMLMISLVGALDRRSLRDCHDLMYTLQMPCKSKVFSCLP